LARQPTAGSTTLPHKHEQSWNTSLLTSPRAAQWNLWTESTWRAACITLSFQHVTVLLDLHFPTRPGTRVSTSKMKTLRSFETSGATKTVRVNLPSVSPMCDACHSK
jgi:hypothetical protein